MSMSESMPPPTMAAQQALPLQQLKQACTNIRALLRSLHEQRVRAREQNKPLDKTQFKADRWQVLVLLRALKAGLRDTFLAADAWKTRVQEQKNVVEAHQLKLQNLLYEKDHLLREIRRCRGFSTKEMDKIEFEQGKLPFGVDAETHRQHLDQLTQELETRKRMITQLKQLKQRIEQIDAATQTKQTFLDGLRNEVSTIEDATKALQLYMGEPVTTQLRRQHDASALPAPLYALFCELEAYSIASDSSQTMALAVVDAAPLTTGAKTSSSSHLKRSFPSALQTGASASDQDKTTAEASAKRLRGPSRSPSVATIQPVADTARVPPSRSPSVLRTPAAASPSPALETGEVVVTSTAEKLLALRPYDESANSSASGGTQDSETRPSRSPAAQSNDQDMDVDDVANDDLASRNGNRQDLWTPSPKALVLTLSLGIEGERIDGTAAAATFALRFQYLPVAKIVTVELVKPAKASGAAPVPLSSVLMNLFPGDDGLSIPRLATNYAFMDAHGAETVFPHDAACRPYYWAQWICGLHAAKRPIDMSADDNASAQPHRPEPSVRSVMTQLVKRLVTSVHLTKQLDVLATAAPSAPSVVFVHSAVRAQFLSSSSTGASRTTHIESWRPIPAPTHDIFALFHDHASRSQRHDATHGCRYFRVTFKHERAKLAAIVEVAPEYPIRAPRFLFQPKTVGASGKGESGHVATYENQLKEIEVEVNAFYNELVTSESEAFVLMHQLRKVELCFDVLNSALADGSTATLCFGRERRGKDRRQAIVMDSASKELRHR